MLSVFAQNAHTNVKNLTSLRDRASGFRLVLIIAPSLKTVHSDSSDDTETGLRSCLWLVSTWSPTIYRCKEQSWRSYGNLVLQMSVFRDPIVNNRSTILDERWTLVSDRTHTANGRWTPFWGMAWSLAVVNQPFVSVYSHLCLKSYILTCIQLTTKVSYEQSFNTNIPRKSSPIRLDS